VDFLALQRTISEDVAASLALQLLDAPSEDVEPAEVPDAEAYELFLEGQFLLNQRTAQSIEKALDVFARAAELDPELVPVQVGIAEGWILAGAFDAVLPRQAEERAMAAVDRVLELEPGNSAGLLARAYVRFAFGWRWQEAEADFLAVLERSPNFSEAHQAYAGLLLSQGRYDEALAQLAKARNLDPMSLVLRTDRCWYLFYARRFEAAASACRETLELDPGYVHAQDNLKWILIRAGREDEAVEAFLRLLALEGESEATVQRFRRVAERSGLQGMLEKTIRYRSERAAVDPDSVVPYDQALDAAAAGHRQLALEWLGKSFARRETDLMFLAVDPRFDSLRQEPTFKDLLRRIDDRGASVATAP
jgi:tetratricopeptide (TPR) repeat protein